MQQVIHLRRTDPTVDQIVHAAFPGYRGQLVKAVIQPTVEFFGTNWDEGSKRDYRVVRLADSAVFPVADAPYFRESAIHSQSHQIPEGIAVVVLDHFRGREHIEIITPAANITPLLPAPVDLTDDERVVLRYTRSLKSSYAGIKNYRHHEAQRETGITLARWDAAKASLITKKFLNKAGAITTEGRNVPAGG